MGCGGSAIYNGRNWDNHPLVASRESFSFFGNLLLHYYTTPTWWVANHIVCVKILASFFFFFATRYISKVGR